MAKYKKSHSGKPILLTLFGLIGLTVIITVLLRGNDVILFNPKGFIADEQHRLMLISTLIMLGFGLPILFMLYYFAWKYRETNDKAVHDPHVRPGRLFSFALWIPPVIIMLILTSIMLPATQKLQPQKLIASDKPPLTIQVVALRWKWLFIYPEQNIATVNYVQIPVDTPVQFELTADETPMSSFWIPHLGGMLYAMTGHVNRLNLVADTMGAYEGSAAEINGAGLAGMRFTTRVGAQTDFDQWVRLTAQSANVLNTSEYEKLLQPSENDQPAFYRSPTPDLFSTVLNKYAGSHQHPAEYTE